ncbi:MAG TPA: polysaccharide lyase family protein [Phycisphaerae bacterium]|nr:polysaccharide lyase family protein [Phycisphaerae bacterium]
MRRRPPFFAAVLLLAAPVFAAPDDPVRTVENARTITASNGLISFTMDRNTGRVTSLKARLKSAGGEFVELGEGTGKTIYMHYVDTPEALTESGPNKTVEHPEPIQKNMIRLVSSTPEEADIMAGTLPTAKVPFDIEWHLLLRRGEPGIYTYLTYRHGPGMAAANFVQGGFVVRGVAGPTFFNNYVIDDKRTAPYPAGKVVKTVQDTTWQYDDGTVQAKYDYCVYASENHVYGLAGNHGVGMWMIIPSWESSNGGPLKQELSAHQGPVADGPQTNIMQWIFQGEHFGARGIAIKADENWSKFYGPVFIYINQGPTVDALWADAKKRTEAEIKKWPYGFIKSADYPLVRGKMTGQVHLTDGTSAKDAWVVLTSPGEPDFALASKGYEFWTKADADGRFEIGKIRPGTYRLHISGADQFQDFHKDNVVISPDKTTDLGTLQWKPITHGKRLWEIGVADRNTREFKNGDDYRHYDNFLRYIKDFPNDVTFTIGRSRESDDWNMGQWMWYNQQPYWAIVFDSPEQQKGTATLTIALAAADAPKLDVSLNGELLKTLEVKTSGSAVYRSGGQDSYWQVFPITFDASKIHAGKNEIHLALPGAYPYAGHENERAVDVRAVFYDAIRLEVGP